MPFTKTHISLLCLSVTAWLGLQAQEMQTGFGFVTSIRGTVEAQTPDGAKPALKLHQSEKMDGMVIKTEANAEVFLVLSNGVALALTENTHIEIKAFKQIPFSPHSTSFEYEPTVSNLHIRIIEGRIGLSCVHISPLSNLKIEMHSGYLSVHSTTSVISVNSLGMNVSAYEGTLTFYYPNGTEREFIAQPQSVRISEQSAARGIVTEQGTVDGKEIKAQELANAVNFARKRVIYRSVPGVLEPQPLLLVSNNYLDQAPARPYSFKQ
ncbi:MAG: hypothetical protein GWO81_07350 [Verrucomicrobia bacterium]|nr:hypothetical protein [Verrucomicrobiota bacterium]